MEQQPGLARSLLSNNTISASAPVASISASTTSTPMSSAAAAPGGGREGALDASSSAAASTSAAPAQGGTGGGATGRAAASANRSKSGCYTCRAKKKKCPEDFDQATGKCSLCIRAAVHCERSVPVRKRGSNPQRAASASAPGTSQATAASRRSALTSALSPSPSSDLDADGAGQQQGASGSLPAASSAAATTGSEAGGGGAASRESESYRRKGRRRSTSFDSASSSTARARGGTPADLHRPWHLQHHLHQQQHPLKHPQHHQQQVQHYPDPSAYGTESAEGRYGTATTPTSDVRHDLLPPPPPRHASSSFDEHRKLVQLHGHVQQERGSTLARVQSDPTTTTSTTSSGGTEGGGGRSATSSPANKRARTDTNNSHHVVHDSMAIDALVGFSAAATPPASHVPPPPAHSSSAPVVPPHQSTGSTHFREHSNNAAAPAVGDNLRAGQANISPTPPLPQPSPTQGHFPSHKQHHQHQGPLVAPPPTPATASSLYAHLGSSGAHQAAASPSTNAFFDHAAWTQAVGFLEADYSYAHPQATGLFDSSSLGGAGGGDATHMDHTAAASATVDHNFAAAAFPTDWSWLIGDGAGPLPGSTPASAGADTNGSGGGGGGAHQGVNGDSSSFQAPETMQQQHQVVFGSPGTGTTTHAGDLSRTTSGGHLSSQMDGVGAAAAETSGKAVATSGKMADSDEDDAAPEGLTEEMAAIYDAMNHVYLAGVPSSMRDTQTRRWRQIARSTQLGRAASAALVSIYMLREPENNSEDRQKRLLAQSDKYFQRAVTHLSDNVPLEGQLNALIDLYAHQFYVVSAAAAFAVLAVGDIFVTQALGPHPSLDMSTLAGRANFSVRFWAYIDTFRAVSQSGRRTCFNFVGGPPGLPVLPTPANESTVITATNLGDIDSTDDDPGGAAALSPMPQGVPATLLVCLATSANLAVCVTSGLVSKADVPSYAAAIEHEVKVWKPLPPSAADGPPPDSFGTIADMATKEMWRHATLLHLHQTVLKLGCLSTRVRDSLKQIISLGSSISVPSGGAANAWAVRSFPWFMASTVAIDAADREACRKGLRECGNAKVYMDNLRAAEILWARMDSTGRERDWKEVLREEGLCVAFL